MTDTSPFPGEAPADAAASPETPPYSVIHCRGPRSPYPQIATLASAKIPYSIEQLPGGCYVLVVPRELEAAARHELLSWRLANRHWPPKKEPEAPAAPVLPPYPGCGLWNTLPPLLLGAFFLFTGPFSPSQTAHMAGCWNLDRILAGEWWRCITSLTLHADGGHLLGNAVAFWGFGYAICRRVGIGIGWLGILLSGFLGNWISAWGHSPEAPLAIGASTATFGALGILVAFQTLGKIQLHLRIRHPRIWIPGIAGLLLLGFLGMAPNADQTGHLCGFVAGFGLGLALHPATQVRLNGWLQASIAVLAIVLPAVAWQLALRQS